MNEAKIRERLHQAIGEANYPLALPNRVETRLGDPLPERHPRAIALAAAIIALALVAALLGPRLLTWHPSVPAGSAPPAATPLAQNQAAFIPPGDFWAAGLTSASALVTPFQLKATSANHTLTLIGAYADPARTVLLFRTNPDFRLPIEISFSDDGGLINASSSSGSGLPGESYYSLDAGPRPGANGVANLTVTVRGFSPSTLADGFQTTPGTWTFSLALKVQPSVAIAAVPGQFVLGTWKVTTEVAEVTPSVIHIQAVIDGASVGEVGSPVTLLDPSGTPVGWVASSAGVTVPKGQLNSTNYKTTRINDQWLRPTAAGTYQLRFAGGGGAQMINISVAAPDPSAALPVKGGNLLQPTDFPESQMSLNLQGFLTTTITSGRPNQCGYGSGPSGALFAFGTYFQVDGVWYSLSLYSDPAVRQYSGPGTYSAPAVLLGPTQRLYAGTVQLTVADDRRPDSGSVQGTLDRVGTTTKEPHLSISGTWTCTPGQMLGPG